MRKLKISNFKSLLPVPIKRLGRRLIKFFKYSWRYWLIRRAVYQSKHIKIIIGAAETYQNGWYSTNENWLDITKAVDWANIFKGKCILTHVLAEHVFEHLTYEECQIALKHINRHMQVGGLIRVAVPDGNHPKEEYLRHVGINGIGDDAADHKQLLSVEIWQSLLQDSGFESSLIEGYDEKGRLVQKVYSPEDGFVRRSRTSPEAHDSKRWGFVDACTSLIVDGIKQ